MSSQQRELNVQWLVGVDGSKGSGHALRWSVSLAEARSARIRVVRAWQPRVSAVGELDLPFLAEQVPEAARAELDELAASLGEAGQIEWTVESGNPSSTLIDAAEGADLLVLGTRGLGGFKRLLLGSVSHQCAAHAHVPVAVIPPSASLDGRVDRIVIGMDGSPNAKAALRWALDFAGSETTVHIVGVWEPSVLATEADRQDFDYLSEPARERFTEAIDEVCGARTGDEVNLEADFRYANAAAALLECGSEADLLVVGARGQGLVASAILGSVASRVLHQAPCPVVVVPRPKD